MDEGLKQLIAVVIAVAVGVFLIAYITTGGFQSKITENIDSQVDSLLSVRLSDDLWTNL